MDSIFMLDQADRSAFLKHVMQSFGSVHVCLWSYVPPPSNCLLPLDGLYAGVGTQPTLATQLFDVYRESVIYVDTGRTPGLAFKNSIPYMELKLHEFQSLVSSEVQLQFYQQAGIQTVVFMGCAAGEVEIGLPNDPQIDIVTEIKNLIPMGFPGRSNQRPSSSSSSLQSLSADSPELSPLLFNILSSSFLPEPSKEPLTFQEAPRSAPPIAIEDQAAREALNQIRNTQFPSIESEDAAMTKAILAVLSSPSTSSSSQQTGRNPSSAFTRYRAMPSTAGAAGIGPKQSKFKRAVLFFRNMNWRNRQEFQVQGNRPSATQLHHMISERRRREKLNESFHVLRSLLPPGTKKDKASVLSSTTEYLSSLKSEMAQLRKRAEMLESQLLARKAKPSLEESCSEERVNVEITQVSSSTSEARFLDLRVSVRGESSMLDLVIRLLEFLKQQLNATLVSLESNTRMSETVTVNGVVLRLRIEGDEFDESGFEEGVRRAVDDQTQ